jgi:predicted Fe-S protein YdhL (DUF1289 family)
MNWNKMTDKEREATKKRIAKRNKERLSTLEEKAKLKAIEEAQHV